MSTGSFWTPKGRSTPYTALGIKRKPCVRCGGRGAFQWSVCADGNAYRVLCLDCDIALNKLALEWANDPDAGAKIAVYEARQRALGCAPAKGVMP